MKYKHKFPYQRHKNDDKTNQKTALFLLLIVTLLFIGLTKLT